MGHKGMCTLDNVKNCTKPWFKCAGCGMEMHQDTIEECGEGPKVQGSVGNCPDCGAACYAVAK